MSEEASQIGHDVQVTEDEASEMLKKSDGNYLTRLRNLFCGGIDNE